MNLSNEDRTENSNDGVSRRTFVKQASLTGGLAFPTIVPAFVLGAYAPQ